MCDKSHKNLMLIVLNRSNLTKNGDKSHKKNKTNRKTLPFDNLIFFAIIQHI